MEVYDFGMRLQELRKKKGLTQRQVSKKINLSQSVVSAYEANLNLPSIETLCRLAILFSTSTDYLLGMKNEIVISTKGLSEEQRSVINSLADNISTLCNKLAEANRTDD